MRVTVGLMAALDVIVRMDVGLVGGAERIAMWTGGQDCLDDAIGMFG